MCDWKHKKFKRLQDSTQMNVMFYTPKVVNLIRSDDTYHTIPILSFVSDCEMLLLDLLKEIAENSSHTFNWEGNFLKGIYELDVVAEKLFQTKEIGIIYFVNKNEPSISSDMLNIKKGDHIELVYIRN